MHPTAYLHIAAQRLGPALMLESRGNAASFDKLHKACTLGKLSIQLVDPGRSLFELHLVPSRARRANTAGVINVLYGYVVYRSILRRIETRRLALPLDFDETIAHCISTPLRPAEGAPREDGSMSVSLEIERSGMSTRGYACHSAHCCCCC
jgi:hypothetical protein